MIDKGTIVAWQSNNKSASGVVRDYYNFKTKPWSDKYRRALLIEQSNKTFVLKLEADINVLSD